MARCRNGHENPEGQRFCGTCGEPLLTSEANEPTRVTPTPGSTPPGADLRTASTASGPAAAGTPRGRRWIPIAAIAGVIVVVVLIGVFTLGGGGGSDDGGHTLRGDFVVFGDCGLGGYDDIYHGQQVIVRDRDGKTLAKGELGPERGDCEFSFTVRDIPDAPFYGVEISHRGELTYTKDELEDLNWRVFLSLGEPGDDL